MKYVVREASLERRQLFPISELVRIIEQAYFEEGYHE